MAQRRIKCRLIVATIVVDPTPDDGIEYSCQVVDRLVHSTAQLPVTNRCTDRLGRGVTDTGTEVDEEFPPPILRPSSLKSIPEKVKLLIGIIPAPIIILAVDDFLKHG